MNSKSLFLAVLLGSVVVGLTGCADTAQRMRIRSEPSTVCLVDNPSVRPQVFLTLRRALMDKGLNVVRVQANDQRTLSSCRQTLRYGATFGSSWSYSALRYAKLELTEVARHNKVYTVQWDERHDKPTLLDNVNDSSIEIRELVDQLFPTEIPWQ